MKVKITANEAIDKYDLNEYEPIHSNPRLPMTMKCRSEGLDFHLKNNILAKVSSIKRISNFYKKPWYWKFNQATALAKHIQPEILNGKEIKSKAFYYFLPYLYLGYIFWKIFSYKYI